MKYKVNFELELRKNTYKGIYIALEGIDGSGKTTQASELAKYFKSQGREVIVTAEPTREGEVGKLIHKILSGDLKIPKEFNQYLFSADRGVHQHDLIIPSLEAGKVVISDRCFWSTLAYGILDRGEKDDNYDQLLVAYSILSLYHQFLAPDYSIILKIDTDTAVERLLKKSKQEIYENREMVEKVKKIYGWMIEKFNQEFIVVDGSRHIDEVTSEIVSKIK